VSTAAAAEEEVLETFSFDEEFQSEIVALVCRDPDFCQRTDGLIRPEYFSNELHAGLVSCFLDHFAKYATLPKGKGAITEVIKDGVAKKRFHKGIVHEIPATLAQLNGLTIADRQFVIDKVAEFAKHQAIKRAILDSVEMVDRREFDKIESAIKKACQVGVVDVQDGVDYWAMIDARRQERELIASGARPATGVPTGNSVLDECLYHRGWGKKELSIYMGGPKSGKTMALIDSAQAAALSGYNVLAVTLEVSAKIYGDRFDANLAEVALGSLNMSAKEVAEKIEHARLGAGLLRIHEYPTGTLTPKALHRLIQNYKGKGITFDLVALDYADLMAPDIRSQDAIQNSKSVYEGLRAIAQIEDVAMLSATQTNREGFQQAVQRMEHVSDDINKVRICDILISINVTEDERLRNERRLFIAASRNQESDITIRVKVALERAKFIAAVLGKE
jgi:replicative DNA helicase